MIITVSVLSALPAVAQTSHGPSEPPEDAQNQPVADEPWLTPPGTVAAPQPAPLELPPGQPIEPEYRRNWYGWQLLLADVVAVGVTNLDPFNGDESYLVGGVLFSLSGPTIHAVNGNWGRAGLSLGIRTAVSLAAWGVGRAAYGGSAEDGDGFVNPLPIAFIAGSLLAASAVDITALSYKRVPVAPAVTPVDRGATFGVSGSF